MTLTASLGKASDNLSLMGHTDVIPGSKEQSCSVEIDTENTQDFTAVLGKVFKCPCYNVFTS